MKNFLFRKILGEEGRLIEIMNEDDQELVIHVTRQAEEYFDEDPRYSYWWTGLEALGEIHSWTWITSELRAMYELSDFYQIILQVSVC